MSVDHTYDEDCYSDLHKDVYGFRPRGDGWTTMTPDQKQKEWDFLLARLDEVVTEERRMEIEAAEVFERRVAETIATGAKDRETALRWIYDADIGGVDFIDWDYLCFHNGLRYGYFKQVA